MALVVNVPNLTRNLGSGKNRIDLRYLLIYLLGSLEIKSKVISSLGL
jgi:hypothetical protein